LQGVWGRGWLPYAAMAIVMLVLRLPTLTNRILSIDEASYLVHALRLESFEQFVYAFQYRVETKTQVGLLPYLLANAIDRQNAILIIHALGLAMMWVSGALMITISRRFLGSAWAGLAAAVMWAVYLVVGPGSPVPYEPEEYEFFQAPRLEYFQTPLLLASLLFFLLGAEAARKGRKPGWLLGWSGVAWAFACLVKPSGVTLGPLLLLTIPLFWPAVGRRFPPLKEIARAGVPFVVGAALPVAITFAPYLFRPEALAELRFSLLEVGGEYASSGSRLDNITHLIEGMPPLLLLTFALFPFLLFPTMLGLREHEAIPDYAHRTLLLLVVLSPGLFAGVAFGQSHLYYLVPIIPFMALAVAGYAGLLVKVWHDEGRRRLSVALALLAVLAYLGPQTVALFLYPARSVNDAYLGRDRRRFDLDGIVAYIRETTEPKSKLWVYYNTPEIILLADRLPATRDPAGIWLNYIWKEPWFSRTADDLEAEEPTVIVGIDGPRYHYPHTVPLLEVPELGARIQQRYSCDTERFRGATVCTLDPQKRSQRRDPDK
jgi:hypothetical protein